MKAKFPRLLAYARREIHHVQAAVYVAGAGLYQLVIAAGGYEAVKLWHLKDWLGHALVVFGPAALFMMRGQHVSTDEVVSAVRKGDAP